MATARKLRLIATTRRTQKTAAPTTPPLPARLAVTRPPRPSSSGSPTCTSRAGVAAGGWMSPSPRLSRLRSSAPSSSPSLTPASRSRTAPAACTAHSFRAKVHRVPPRHRSLRSSRPSLHNRMRRRTTGVRAPSATRSRVRRRPLLLHPPRRLNGRRAPTLGPSVSLGPTEIDAIVVVVAAAETPRPHSPCPSRSPSSW